MGVMVEGRERRIAAGLERFLWIAAVLVTVAACSDDDPAGPGASPAVAVVEVAPDDVILAPGDTITLAAKLFASDGSEITGRPVTWLSSATQFATVNASGRVTAVAAGGPVLITATSEGKTGPAFVIVATTAEAPELVQLDPATVAAGSGPVSITVLGQGFAEDAEARWNGAARATTWLAAGVLEIELTAADVAQAGQGEIRVYNPGPGSGLSAPITLPIVAGGS